MTKVLAACVALIEQKINFLKEEFSGSIGEVNQRIDSIGNLTLSESERKELSESILDAVPLKSLPKELVFISELTDLKKELLNKISTEDTHVREYIEQNFEVIGRAIVSIRDQFNNHHHDDSYAPIDHDHDHLATKENLSVIAKSLDDHNHDSLYVTIDNHDSSIKDVNEKIESTVKQLLDVAATINDEVSTKATKASIASLKSATKTSLKAIEASVDDLVKNLDNHKDSLEKRLVDHSDAIDVLSEHTRSQYAQIDHSHEDVASKEFVESIHNDVKQFNLELSDLNRFVTDQIDDVIQKISSKQDSGEFITKEELDSHKKDVLDTALKSIPIPENGKDALGWDFKGHPTKKGVLLHKRDDWKEYKEIVLFDDKWINNLTKKFGDALHQQREMEQPRFGMASGAVAPSAMASLDDVVMTGIQNGYGLIYDQSINKFIPSPIGGSLPTDEEMPYSKRVDFITDDELYKGEAAVGSSESSPAWRIRKLTIGLDGDVTEIWADGNSNYDNIWTNRLTYSYI